VRKARLAVFIIFPPPPPLPSYQNILMNLTRYRLRHLSFCRCVSGNVSTPISSTANTLLSQLPPSPLLHPAHASTDWLQCTQINMSNLLKDRAKIVSVLSLGNYKSGETEIDSVQTDGCCTFCLPFDPDSPVCISCCEEAVSSHYIHSERNVARRMLKFEREVWNIGWGFSRIGRRGAYLDLKGTK
jgi:hypothetical protein